MKFEEYVSNDIDRLLKEYVVGGTTSLSFKRYKEVWKKLNFSRIHYVTVNTTKTIHIIYAVILLKLHGCIKGDTGNEENDIPRIVGLVYTLITVYYTQVSPVKEPIRIRISDYNMLIMIQEKFLSVEKKQITDVIQILLEKKCLTIAAYIGPVGFKQSMKTATNDWKTLIKNIVETKNDNDTASTVLTYLQANHRIQERLNALINVEEIDVAHKLYDESVKKLVRALENKQNNNGRRSASFLKPFRPVHGKAAGHVSSRNISSNRLKRDLRYSAAFNPNNKRFKSALNNFKIHAQKEKIKIDLKNRAF